MRIEHMIVGQANFLTLHVLPVDVIAADFTK